MKMFFLLGLLISTFAHADKYLVCTSDYNGNYRLKEQKVKLKPNGTEDENGQWWLAEIQMRLDKGVIFNASAEWYVRHGRTVDDSDKTVMRSSLMTNGSVIRAYTHSNELITDSDIDGGTIGTSCHIQSTLE